MNEPTELTLPRMVKLIADLLEDHQRVEPHHAHLCPLCKEAAAVLAEVGASISAVGAQPEAGASLKCLMRGYVHDNLLLDLYGYADEDDGCSVEAVTLAGSKVDLSGLLTLAQMSKMGWAVDRAGVEARTKSRDEARAERAVWNMAAA